MREAYLIVWCAAALSLGVWAADAAEIPPVPAGVGGFFLAALSLGLRALGRKRAAWVCCLLFACAAGMARMGIADTAWRAQSLRLAGASGTFSAVISGEALCVSGPEGYVRYPAEASSVRYSDGAVYPVRGALYVYVPWSGEEPLAPDTAVSVTGTLSPFRFYKNPGKMDLEHRYRSRRLIGRIYAEAPGAVEAAGPAGEFPLEALAARVRGSVRASFAPYVDGARLSVLMTLLFGGHYDELPEGVLEGFTATGIVHILSVSGSHMALLFGFLCLLGRWLRLPERAVLPLAALAMLAYAALAGFVPPVVRAAVMGVLAVAALFFHRDREAGIALGTAAGAMLLWDPYYLFDVSFQLSVGASAGIVLLYRPLLRALRRLPLPEWARQGTAMALAAQLLTMPVVLWDFHRLPLYFLPANLFVTPLLEGSIIAGLAAAFFAPFFTPLAGGLLQGADYALWGALRLNGWLASLPHASLPAGGMAAAETALYYGAIILALTRGWWGASVRRRALAAGALAALLGGCGLSYARRPEAEVFVPDLGTSRAAVLSAGGRTVVYYRDGGLPLDMGERELRSVLEYRGIFAPDVLIGDFTACPGETAFTLALPVKEIWLSSASAAKAGPVLAAHPESAVRVTDGGRMALSGSLSAATDGRSWYFAWGECAWFIDGGAPLRDVRPAAHRVWIGGAEPFRPAVNHDTMEWFLPEAAVYAGGRGAQAGEDRDWFLLSRIPLGDPSLDGMVTVLRRDGAWEMEKYSPSGMTEDFFSLK